MENDNQLPNSSNDSQKPVSPGASYSAHGEQSFRLPTWTKVSLLVGVIALASVGSITAWYLQKPPAQKFDTVEADPDEVAKRKTLQDFILSDSDGTTKKLSDYKGNVVILSFWASWCTPCLVELPTFAEIEKKFHDQGLRILPVNVDEGEIGKTFSKEFWAKKNFKFPSFIDSQKQLAQAFEVDMLPSNFVIDRKGRLVFSGFGANDWSSSETQEFLQGLLQESTDAKPAAEEETSGG